LVVEVPCSSLGRRPTMAQPEGHQSCGSEPRRLVAEGVQLQELSWGWLSAEFQVPERRLASAGVAFEELAEPGLNFTVV